MPDLFLEGLGEPVLAQYLAALGIFRAISEQRDPEATLSFDRGVPRIRSALDEDRWCEWVIEEWQPSPIASPWNRGAGFYGSSKAVACVDKQKRNGVELILATTDPRLETYRGVLSRLINRLNAIGYATAPEKEQKAGKGKLLAELRNGGPDAWLPWLDAASVIEPSAEGKDPEPRYLALLGSGGNDGRLELGNSYMIHLCNVLDFDGSLMKRPKKADVWSRGLLRGLLGEQAQGMVDDTAGQLAPSSRGAPNGTSGLKSFSAEPLLNPWLFLWALEGTYLFAGASTRRLGSHGRARAAFPFHAERVDAGYGTAGAEKGKDELWLPTWARPSSYREVRHLFGEARAQVGRRRAQSGLDYARAIGGLGSVRGVGHFHRFAIVERAGQSNIAMHVGTFASGESKALDRLRGLDNYVQGFRRLAQRKNVPGRFVTAWRGFEDAVLAVAQSDGEPSRVTALLAALGRLRREEARGLPSDERGLRGFQLHDAGWLKEADRSHELALAVALATLGGHEPFAPLASYMWPGKGARLTSRDASRLDLVGLMESILDRRLLEHQDVSQGVSPHRPTGGASGLAPASLLAFQRGEIDDERALNLLWFCTSLRASWLAEVHPEARRCEAPIELSGAWIIARLAIEGALPVAGDWVPVRSPRGVPEAMRAGRSDWVLQRATHVLRAASHPPRPVARTDFGGLQDRRRMAASLLIPLPLSLLHAFVNRLVPRAQNDSKRGMT